MKKFRGIIALLLGVVAMFGIAGCGSDTQSKLQSQIDELQSQIEGMEDRIEKLEKELCEMQNYILKISADKQVYRIEDEILIDIVLENYSGEDLEIAYYSLFCPDSSTGQFPACELPPVTTKKIFEKGEGIRMTDRLGGCFPVGQHRLKYRAIFYLGWETTESVVEVWSNTIDISVIK